MSLSRVVIVLVIIITSAGVLSAGVLGKRYVGFDLVHVDSDLNGDGISYGTEVRFPAIGVVDLVGAFSRTNFEDTYVNSAEAGLDMHGVGTEWIESYFSIGGLITVPEEGDRESGILYGGGMELNLNEAISLAVGGAVSQLKKEGEVAMTLGLSWWLTDQVLGTVDFVKGVDSIDPGPTTVGIELAIGF
jgi:hypothetical protein